jgi:LuxR family quorum-sensing transcriptional regulator LasR
MIGSLGIEYVQFAVAPDKLLFSENAFIKSNYPQQWQATYKREKMDAIDPILSHCRNSSIPITWRPDIFVTPAQQALYQEASNHGLRFGISLPIHGPDGEFGMLSCASCSNDDAMRLLDDAEFLAHLALMRDYAFESSRRFFKKHQDSDKLVKLTARERECLTWLVAGKSSWEISKIINCAEVTVNFHINNIKGKFNVRTRQQAIAKAIMAGALSVLPH